MDRTGHGSTHMPGGRMDLLERLREPLADRYELEELLADGPASSVIRARDLKHGRPVTLKALHPELSAAVAGQRFLREIDTIAGLSHPHILTLIDSGDAAGLWYFVVPHTEGESLRQRLDRDRQLPLNDAIRIAIDVADGLDHAHRKGVVHRDITPASVFLSEGHAAISDFGIARAIDDAGGARLTAVGVRLGAPEYASPEQLDGEQRADARTDIYSLGCVLYEMLVGHPPLVGGTLEKTIRRRLLENPPSAREVRDTVPPRLDAAIRKALARLPADRFATAASFREALQAAALEASASTSVQGTAGPGDGRRLAAVVSLDVAGYSRLMEADENETLARLRTLRTGLVEPLITRFRGRVVKGTGDGVLAEFGSAVDAVECADAIQREMSDLEAGVPEDRRIQFRIGINVGDILVEGGDIFGDGVNVAARVEGLAEPGGIALSASAYDQVQGKVNVGFRHLGPRTVKNLERPIHVYRVATDAAAGEPHAGVGVVDPPPAARGGLRGLLDRALRSLGLS